MFHPNRCAVAGTHEAKGWPNSAYGMSKMGVTALTRVQAAKIATDPSKEGVVLTCVSETHAKMGEILISAILF